MKASILIIILFILFISFDCLSQETIDVKFNEADPLWVHTMVDTTFIPVAGQPYFTKYSSLTPHIVHGDENFLYTMAVCLQKQSLDDYGFILDKLDIKTGKKIWSHHNTPYNSGQKDIYQSISLFGENIEMVGAVEDENKFKTSYKKLNKNTGELVKYIKSHNKLPETYTRYFTGHVLYSDSLLLNAYTYGEDISTPEKEMANYGLYTLVFDNEMNEISLKRNLFDFDSLGLFSIDQPNYTLKLNKNNLISLAYKDRYESWNNQGTKLMWADISDPSNIKTNQILDLTNIIPGTKESFLLQRFNAINNTIHLSHYYPNFDIQKYTCYILWLDSIGKIKTYIPIPKYGDHIYQFADMFYANNDFAYLFSFPSITKKPGFDIIRIESGLDSIKFINSLTVKNEVEEFGTQVHTLDEDGYLVFGGFVKKMGEGTKTSTKYFCFKASDLGINFEPVQTSNIEYSKNDFDIFPNPSSNTIFLKLLNHSKNIEVNIVDITGKLCLSNTLNDKYNQIDISTLSKGIYFTYVMDEKGAKIGSTKKIIKIE